jgi:hypothetical protein
MKILKLNEENEIERMEIQDEELRTVETSCRRGQGSPRDVAQRRRRRKEDKASRPALRVTKHLIQWVSGAISRKVKQTESEADHSRSFVQRPRIIELQFHSFIHAFTV